MEIVTTTKITLSFSDLENILREKGFITKDSELKNIVKGPSNSLRIEFEKTLETSEAISKSLDKETFLSTPLKELGVSARVINCLHPAKITTPKQLLEISIENLKKLRNLGKNSIAELNGLLKTHNLSLREK